MKTLLRVFTESGISTAKKKRYSRYGSTGCIENNVQESNMCQTNRNVSLKTLLTKAAYLISIYVYILKCSMLRFSDFKLIITNNS
jgi:hypothetical protein